MPDPEQINEIVWLVINFMRQNPGQWIVLHCTHGFNRTGMPACTFRFSQTCQLFASRTAGSWLIVRSDQAIAAALGFVEALRLAVVESASGISCCWVKPLDVGGLPQRHIAFLCEGL